MHCIHIEPEVSEMAYHSTSVFPLLFRSLCVHKIYFVQHFTRTWAAGKSEIIT